MHFLLFFLFFKENVLQCGAVQANVAKKSPSILLISKILRSFGWDFYYTPLPGALQIQGGQ